MIWIECDCCGKTLPTHEGYVACTTKSYGAGSISVNHTSHLCEPCFLRIKRAAEVVKHEAYQDET